MSQVISGARVIFQINNNPVLFANSVSYQINHRHDPLYELDSTVPAEYYETVSEVEFTVNMFRVPSRSATTQGIIPQIKNLVVQPELSATLIDTVTFTPIFRIDRVKCISENFIISARTLGTSELRFKGVILISDFQF